MPKWTPELDRMLFLAIINHQEVKVDSKAAADMLGQEGVSCTPRAIEERLKRLKKMAKDGFSSPDDDNNDNTPSKSESKPSRKKSVGNKGTSSSKPKSAKRARYAFEEDEDVIGLSDAPTARVKQSRLEEEANDEA